MGISQCCSCLSWPYCNTEADMNPLASKCHRKSYGIDLFVAAVLTDQVMMLWMVVSISVSNMRLMSPSCSAWWCHLGGLPVRSPHLMDLSIITCLLLYTVPFLYWVCFLCPFQSAALKWLLVSMLSGIFMILLWDLLQLEFVLLKLC